MDRIAQARPADRADLFRQAAAELKPERSPTIIEKDFWVCWILKKLFCCFSQFLDFFSIHVLKATFALF